MTPTKNVIDAYTKLAPVYETTLRSTSMVAPDVVENFFATLHAGTRLLDAGCGPGVEARLAYALGHQVVGLDITPGMIERFRTELPHSEAVVGSLTEIPFADASFGAVFAASSLLHLPQAEGEKALTELTRVLAPGGRFFLATMIQELESEGDFHTRPVLSENGVGSLYFFYWNHEALRKKLADVGLTVTSWTERELVPNRPRWAFITGHKGVA